MEKFYITTPIYYPSDKLHIGHSYCTVAADTMARYKRMRGFDVKFLTGSDEHGQKIENIAKQKNITPKEYVDNIVKGIKELWEIMDVKYDYYIRTTDKTHKETVQKIFKQLYEQGDIYKSYYEGLYCTPCESFFTETQLIEGKCPDCNRNVEKIKEESYFFRLSKYQDRLIKHIENNPDFIYPESRRKEMMSNFLNLGLEDICVSRSSFKWGIPVDFDESHIIYVWIDALSNYISALGYKTDSDEDFKRYWPADVHVVGKEIVRFHAIIWPAILMALSLPLPKQIFGHGWLVINGGKMSKSKGNVVDPKILVEKYGVDAIRYFLLREVSFGQDGNFSNEALIQRINSDLANDLGNLLSRTVSMIEKYFDGTLTTNFEHTNFDNDLINFCNETVLSTEKDMDKMSFSNALSNIWALIRKANKYIDNTTPWIIAKDESKKPMLANILYNLSETLRIIAILVTPSMPKTPEHIFNQLNITEDNFKTWDSAKTFGKLNKNVKVSKGEIIFPRIDAKKELEELEMAIKESQKNSVANINKNSKDKISFEEFNKLELKVGEIIECEKVKKSNKLLKSQIKIGKKVIQVISGIANCFEPKDMIGKKVVVVTNLKSAKLCGEISEGMILAASDTENQNIRLVTIEDKENIIESGAIVK